MRPLEVIQDFGYKTEQIFQEGNGPAYIDRERNHLWKELSRAVQECQEQKKRLGKQPSTFMNRYQRSCENALADEKHISDTAERHGYFRRGMASIARTSDSIVRLFTQCLGRRMDHECEASYPLVLRDIQRQEVQHPGGPVWEVWKQTLHQKNVILPPWDPKLFYRSPKHMRRMGKAAHHAQDRNDIWGFYCADKFVDPLKESLSVDVVCCKDVYNRHTGRFQFSRDNAGVAIAEAWLQFMEEHRIPVLYEPQTPAS